MAALAMPGVALADSSTSTSSASAVALPTDFSISAGFSDWSGHFGAPTKTNIWSALLSGRYQIGGLRITAAIPRMRISSDGAFFTGLGGSPLFVAPNISSTKHVREGWGDLTLGAAYLMPGGEERGFDLEVFGNVKVPTASKASQLSTGKADYSAGAEVSKSFGAFTPSVRAAYRVFGDTAAFNFRNGFDITAGSTYSITPKTIVLLNYEYARASSIYIKDSHELLGGISTPILNDRFRLTGYVSKGLSQGASDVSGGASVAFRF